MRLINEAEAERFAKEGKLVGQGAPEKGTWYNVYELNNEFAAIVFSDWGVESGELIRPDEASQYVDLAPEYAHLESTND